MYAFKFVFEAFQNYNLEEYDICNIENSPFNADVKGLFLGINEKRGLYINWRWQNQGLSFVKKGAVVSQLVPKLLDKVFVSVYAITETHTIVAKFGTSGEGIPEQSLFCRQWNSPMWKGLKLTY